MGLLAVVSYWGIGLCRDDLYRLGQCGYCQEAVQSDNWGMDEQAINVYNCVYCVHVDIARSKAVPA